MTEEWAYTALNTAASARARPYTQWLCFPWATLIDLHSKGEHTKAAPLLSALGAAPPRPSLVRATVCQHIRLEEILPWLHRLNITDLFWSHARLHQAHIEGIRVHPFPLYPVQAMANQAVPGQAASRPRPYRYLYSYIGAYQPGLYLTETRRWLAQLPPSADALIKVREEWHYEKPVYNAQIAGQALSHEQQQRLAGHATEFQQVMAASLFALCPSGAGPNSIRLWEALGLGAIPVILADTLGLPGPRREWEAACVQVAETPEDIQRLPQRLARMAQDSADIRRRQHACRQLWNRYIEGVAGTLFEPLSQPRHLHALLHPKARPPGQDAPNKMAPP